MKYLIFLSVAMFHLVAKSQNCDFKINEVDAFTKTEKIRTQDQVISVKTSEAIYFSFYSSNSIYIDFSYRLSGIKSIVIGRDSTLMILLKNEEVIELLPLQTETSTINSINNTEITCMYPVTVEQLEKIKSVGLKKVRLNALRFYYEFDITKEKWVKKLNADIDCFIRKINK